MENTTEEANIVHEPWEGLDTLAHEFHSATLESEESKSKAAELGLLLVLAPLLVGFML